MIILQFWCIRTVYILQNQAISTNLAAEISNFFSKLLFQRRTSPNEIPSKNEKFRVTFF